MKVHKAVLYIFHPCLILELWSCSLYVVHYWSFVSIYRNERTLWSKSKTRNEFKFSDGIPSDELPHQCKEMISWLTYGGQPIWNCQWKEWTLCWSMSSLRTHLKWSTYKKIPMKSIVTGHISSNVPSDGPPISVRRLYLGWPMLDPPSMSGDDILADLCWTPHLKLPVKGVNSSLIHVINENPFETVNLSENTNEIYCYRSYIKQCSLWWTPPVNQL